MLFAVFQHVDNSGFEVQLFEVSIRVLDIVVEDLVISEYVTEVKLCAYKLNILDHLEDVVLIDEVAPQLDVSVGF